MKNCETCGHLTSKSRTCLVSGYGWKYTRQSGRVCDKNFSAWIPRPTIANKWRKLLGHEEE